jgi:hypothetical protein
MAQEFKEHGYNKEEEYFYKKNKVLLEKMRSQLDAERERREKTSGRIETWMRCPKCGSELEEIELLGIKVDQCVGCLGTFFDRGELELLLSAQEPTGFLGSLKRMFKK